MRNNTTITLIPKVKGAKHMKDIRPISLCNVSYKIIVRVVTNRFRSVLAKIIDTHQSAFIPGRLIVFVGYDACIGFGAHGAGKVLRHSNLT